MFTNLFTPTFFTRAITVLVFGSLTACSFMKKAPPAQTVQPVPQQPASVPAVVPDEQPPVLGPKETTWVFTVDNTRSQGKIDLSLDPKGSLLGAKPAQDTAPLSGKILVTVTTHANGKRSIKLKDVKLSNTVKMLMPFKWSRLVGNIAVNIPVNVLKISKHSFPHTSPLGKGGTFHIPHNFFTVGGQAKVQGSGLVLSRAVGKRNIDLTIKKTEPVQLTGTLTVNQGIATLHIPNAVMRDEFDLEGSLLKLTFTGNITAQATVR